MSDGYKEAEDKFECNFQGFDHWITAFGKHMYQAGMKEQREKDAVIAEQPVVTTVRLTPTDRLKKVTISVPQIADAIRNSEV